MNEAENQIDDLEHKGKKHSIRKARRKKNPKKTRIVQAASGTTSRGPILHSHHRGARRRERARN